MIDSVKSTAVLLGFLFCLSIAYYLSFWSHFDIDVFQYMALEDIVKGVAYPLRYAGFALLSFIAYVIVAVGFAEFYTNKHLKGSFSHKAVIILIISDSAAIIFYLLVYYDKLAGDLTLIGFFLAMITGTLLLGIFEAAELIHSQQKKDALQQGVVFDEKHPIKEFIDSLIIVSAAFLFLSAITSGQADAKDILQGKFFDYIEVSNLPKEKVKTTQPYLVLLGSVSDKYVFTDCAHSEHFVIDKDDMHTLQTRHFSIKDTVAMTLFRRELFCNR